MISEARKRAAQAIERPPINFVVGDVEKLPFVSERFDLTLCMETFVHLPVPSRAVQELARVTKRGGLLLANVRLHEIDLDKIWNYPRFFVRKLRKIWWGERTPAQYKGIHRFMTCCEFTSLFHLPDLKILDVRNYGPPTYNLLVIACKT